jgi:histidinol dehydrogenase
VVAIADGSADPVRVAAGLLAQAEHGDDSEALLLTADAELAARVEALVVDHHNVRVERVVSLDDALGRAEEYAPEHLELHVAEPDGILGRIRNAGSVFVGCPSVVGDYAAGATHVLPTGGLARSTGGLGLEAYMKPLQVVTATAEGARLAAEVVMPLARVEGLPRHAEAVAA